MIPRTKTIGIDVSKTNLDYSSQDGSVRGCVSNTAAGVGKLVQAAQSFGAELIVIEATSTYHRLAARSCTEAGLEVLIVQPWRVRSFAIGLGKLAKTDAIDAQVLAWFGTKTEQAPSVIIPVADEKLRDTVVYRQQLVVIQSHLQMMKTQALLNVSYAGTEKILRAVKTQVKALEGGIEKTLKGTQSTNRRLNLLCSLPGFALVNSATALTVLPELGSLSKRQVASLIGLAPFNYPSGTKNAERHIFGGRTRVRSAFYLAARIAVRCDPYFKATYQRLLAAKKKKSVALIACARRLAVIANEVLRSGIPYDVNIQLKRMAVITKTAA